MRPCRLPREKRSSRSFRLVAGLACAAVLTFSPAGRGDGDSLAQTRRQEYDAESRKTVLQLQQFRETQSIRVAVSGRYEVATLTNLNPNTNVWYLLALGAQDGQTRTYHLENLEPRRRLVADQGYPAGVLLVDGDRRVPCPLFDDSDSLEAAKRSGRPYVPLCEARLLLRNQGSGHQTALEAAAEFLRERVWGGELALTLGHHLFAGVNRDRALTREDPTAAAAARPVRAAGPPPAIIDPAFVNRLISPGALGISLARPAPSLLLPGVWYPALDNDGVYVSIIQPGFISRRILQLNDAAGPLDTVEAASLCYLVAFDLDWFELGYARGTIHPGVEWSDHMLPQMKNAALPGPDGIGTIAPLVATGQLNPVEGARAVATFTGGFKRTHGAFKEGALASRNHGSHYGFIENGVVLSRLQPGLATIVTDDNGLLDIKTWTDADNSKLPAIRHARQNGVPLVELEQTSGAVVPGRFVGRWGAGNWSGSEDARLRTIRAGAALVEAGGRRFLVYAVFTAATPAAMARVFQAFHCRYAMLLDMNALEHTYLALYRRSSSALIIEHLIEGMSVLDQVSDGHTVPRFVGFPDNRDFFFLMRRDASQAQP
jgi:hypothetical protein